MIDLLSREGGLHRSSRLQVSAKSRARPIPLTSGIEGRQPSRVMASQTHRDRWAWRHLPVWHADRGRCSPMAAHLRCGMVCFNRELVPVLCFEGCGKTEPDTDFHPTPISARRIPPTPMSPCRRPIDPAGRPRHSRGRPRLSGPAPGGAGRLPAGGPRGVPVPASVGARGRRAGSRGDTLTGTADRLYRFPSLFRNPWHKLAPFFQFS